MNDVKCIVYVSLYANMCFTNTSYVYVTFCPKLSTGGYLWFIPVPVQTSTLTVNWQGIKVRPKALS